MTRRNEVLQRLRVLIESDRYPAGKRLPPERELAADMAVSRGALRRALAILEGEGLVWRHVGKGTFVGRRPDAADEFLFAGSSLQSAESVLEVRSILEPAVARIAAERASSTDLTRMKSHLQAAKSVSDTEAFNHCCDMIHRSLARATHNSILLRLYDALSPIRSLAHAVGEDVELSPAEMDMYWREHADIVDAVIVKDAAAAETAMRRHIGQVWTDTSSTTDLGPGDQTGVTVPSLSALESVLFRPVLLELADRFGETAFLATLKGHEVEIMDAAMPRTGMQTSIYPGLGPRPVDRCAAAKAIVAFLPPDLRHAVVRSTTDEDCDRAALERELDEVREERFARADETLGTGTYSLAVPVGLNGGTVRFSIGLIGTKARMGAVGNIVYVNGITQAIEATIGRLDDVLTALKPYLVASEDTASALQAS